MDTTTVVAAPEVKLLPIDQIQPSPYQARKDFNPEDIQTLADCMKEEGLLQPILVRPSNGSFQLVSGERRYRAAKLLNWPTIEAKVVQTVSEADAAAKGLVENLQRRDLNPIEEAEGFDRLNKLDKDYWTQPQIAKVAGKGQSYVSRSLDLLELPEPVKESMRHRILSRSHALELLALKDASLQKQAANQIIKEDLSLTETRLLVETIVPKAKAKSGKGLVQSPAYKFALKGKNIKIEALIPHGDLDQELAKLGESLRQWLSENPGKPAAAPESPSPLATPDPLPEGRGPTAVGLPPMGEGGRRPDEGMTLRLPQTPSGAERCQ